MRYRYATLVILPLAGCAPKQDATPAVPPEVTFTATDFAFTGPDSIAPGFTTIRMVNQGAQDHHLILGRIDDGKTLQDVMTYAQANPGKVPAYVTWHGAVNGVAAGQADGALLNLPAGNYFAVCFLPDPTDGREHLAKGMIKELKVAGPPSAAAAPPVDGEIRLRDYAFTMPALTAGRHTFKVVNEGPEVHELQVVRLHEGASAQDYLAAMAPGAQGPPPGVMAGGPGAYSQAGEGYWTVTLSPGRYALLCFVPDTTGKPHFMLGMVREVTIPAS